MCTELFRTKDVIFNDAGTKQGGVETLLTSVKHGNSIRYILTVRGWKWDREDSFPLMDEMLPDRWEVYRDGGAIRIAVHAHETHLENTDWLNQSDD